MLVEELLQLLIAKINANLFESVEIKYFKSGDIEDPDISDFLHGVVYQSLVTFLHDDLEGPLVDGSGNAGHGAAGLGAGGALGHPLRSHLQLGLAVKQ